MYKCLDCGHVFETPRKINVDDYYGVSFERKSSTFYSVCPNCEGSIEEAIRCDGCDEYFLEKELEEMKTGRYCPKCYEDEENENII